MAAKRQRNGADVWRLVQGSAAMSSRRDEIGEFSSSKSRDSWGDLPAALGQHGGNGRRKKLAETTPTVPKSQEPVRDLGRGAARCRDGWPPKSSGEEARELPDFDKGK